MASGADPPEERGHSAPARGDDLPEDVRRFVLTRIPSVPYLEALLILRAGGETLRPRALAERLYTSEERAHELVGELRAARLIEPGSDDAVDFRFAPATPELDALIGRHARAYATHLLDITRLIHSNAERKANQFADAFKLRKD
jgi:hypothetical protein